MVFSTWPYRQSDAARAEAANAAALSDIQDALYELPATRAAVPQDDVGFAFTAREYTFFVRTGLAGTTADPLLVGFVSAISTANVVADTYTIDAPGRTGWEITQAGALQYVGLPLGDDTPAFTLDITATLGADLEAHARVNVIAENYAPFRLSNNLIQHWVQYFPIFTDGTNIIPIQSNDVFATYTEQVPSRTPTSANNRIGLLLSYELRPNVFDPVQAWVGKVRDIYLPLGDIFISEDTTASYTYGVECSVPSVIDTAIVANPDALNSSRARRTVTGYVNMLELLMIQPRMTGKASISVFARDQDNQIAGGFTFQFDSTDHTIGGDDFQSRPSLLQRLPRTLRMPRSETASIQLRDYFSMSRYGVPSISELWSVTVWGHTYGGSKGYSPLERRIWYDDGYSLPSTANYKRAVLSNVDTSNIRLQSDRFRYRLDENAVLHLETTATSATGGAFGSYTFSLAVSPNVVGEPWRHSPTQSLTVEIISGLGFAQDVYDFILPAGQTGTPTAYELGTVSAWGNNVTYRLTRGDATKFAVNATTGVVTYTGSGETVDERDTEFVLQITAQQGSDANDTDTAEVVIRVLGVRAELIRFLSDRYEFEIPAGTAGTYTDTGWAVAAVAQDPADTPIIRYVSSDDSVISVAANGDISYEGDALDAGDTATVTITAANGSGPLRAIATTIVEIVAISPNRTTPTITFTGTPYVFSLPEGVTGVVAAPLGTLTATVSDSTAQIRFGIATEGVPFSIDPVSGVLRYTGQGEIYDNRIAYLFQAVATTTSTGTSLAGRQLVFVRVNVTRDATIPDRPVFSQDSYSFTAPAGTAGSTIAIPIGYTPASGADIGYLIVPPSTEAEADWSISTDALITYSGAAKSADTEVVLTVIAETNSSNADLSQRGEAEVQVTVTFGTGTQALQTITWPAGNLTNGRYEFSLEENTVTPHTLATILPTVSAPAGSTAGALALTRGGPDSERFTWSDLGVLVVTGDLDYDTKQVYTVLLTATAAATTTARESVDSRWVKLTLTEDATDVISAPVFSADDYAFNLTEDTPGNVTAVRLGQISAAAREGTLSFAITQGDTTKFAIDASTGEVTYIGAGETAPAAFAITVTATATLGAQTATSSTIARITVITSAKADVTITSSDAPAATFDIPANADGRTTPVYVGTIPFTAVASAQGATIGVWSYTVANANLTATARGSTALIYYVGAPMAAGSGTINTTITARTASTATANAGEYELRLIGTFAEEMPIFTRAAYEFNLSSEADGRTTPVVVGTVTATPAESYAIVLGDTTRFAVNASTGEITYIGAADLAATDTRTLQITATNASETATVNVLITVKSPVTVSFTPAAPTWTLPEGTQGPVVIGSLTVNTRAADPNGLPSAPTLTPGGRDGGFIRTAATGHNMFSISYVGAARTQPLSFTLLGASAENGTALEADSLLTVGVSIVPSAPRFTAASFTYQLPDGTDPPPVYALGTPTVTNIDGFTQVWRIITAQTGQRLFAIDAATGALTYDGPAAADRATTPSYTLQIGVRNQDSGGTQSAEATATVTIGVPIPYAAPVKNDSWTPGAGWIASADGSWHRNMTAGTAVTVNITAGASGPYTIQAGRTANYRNSTVPAPPTTFAVTRSDGSFTITVSSTQTGSETLYLYLSDGITEERIDFHIQVTAAAATPTEVVIYQDSGATYAPVDSRGITANFAEGAAAQVSINFYVAYTQITNRTNAVITEPTLNGFDIITQTSSRRQIQVGSQMIWIDAYEIQIDPQQFDFETQSRYNLQATVNVAAYTAGSITYAAAHKPFAITLNVSDVNEPPARTSLATPSDFGLRKQGATVQFSLAGFWVDPEGRTLSYRLTQSVVGATGGQSTNPSDYLSASIIGTDFQASAGSAALVTPTGVSILFSVESFDGTNYSTPMTFSCDEVHGRALEDSPLAWSSGLPERLVWQVAENIAVPYVLRNDIFATSTVTDLTATAGALTYTLEEATYYPVRNTAYQFANNAPSLDAGATLDIDLTNAFVIEGSDKAGKDFTITATSSNTAALTITVAGKTATLTAANNLSAEGSSTFTLIAHAGGFVAQYVGVATIAAARPAITVKTPLGVVDAAITGAGTQTSPWIPPRRWIAIATDAMFEADSMVDIYSVTVGTTTITPFNDQGFSTTGDVNSLQFGMVAWVLWVNSSSSTAQEVTVRGRLRSDNTATATATVWIQ